MSMALTTKRKQEAAWSLEWARNLSQYPGWSYTSFMEYCRFHGKPPEKGSAS